MELVTIIVPVYNVEKYLRECLDSIVAQTYTELEVIMVDDGSKDTSGKICDEYANKFENFIVIHKENAGLGMARNTGMENMHGTYVTFLDSDDYIDSTLIETMVEHLEQKKVDMCKSGFRRLTDDRQILSTTGYTNEIFAGVKARNVMLPRMIGSRPDKRDSIEMCVCGVLYKTSYIIEHEIRFPSERKMISEDLVFNMNYMQYANGACTISDIGYNYRLNISSLTMGYRPDRFEACRHFYIEIKKKLEELGYDEEASYRLSRMFFIYLRRCVAQETVQLSGKSKKDCMQRIKFICADSVVQEIIKDYPVNKLGIKQKIFIILVRYNMYGVLYLLAAKGRV